MVEVRVPTHTQGREGQDSLRAPVQRSTTMVALVLMIGILDKFHQTMSGVLLLHSRNILDRIDLLVVGEWRCNLLADRLMEPMDLVKVTQAEDL